MSLRSALDASNGAYYGAFTPDGSLVARSQAFDRDDAASAEVARREIGFALAALAWRPVGDGPGYRRDRSRES